ncbi:hypothetical protein GF325_17570, partial [Candidatus Bathyarchaeota archaeon]|nr:hypothetical protein [Candidatus Bathyarchaeota archaeon]
MVFDNIQTTVKRNKARFLFVLVASVSIIASTSSYIAVNAKAQLVAPRLGAPIRTVATNGTGAVDQFLGESMEIIVGTDPADKRAPRSWMKDENWHVGLASVNLENATVVECSVSSIHRIPNPFINTGVLDSPGIARNAVSINARVPSSIPPGTYDIHVSFKQSLPSTAGRVMPGSHQGPARSATMNAGGFLLSQPSCVHVPWVHDSLPSDPPGGNGSGGAGYHDPFSLVHLTDIHFGANPSTRLQLPSSEQYTAPIAEALSILAPDLLI